jgi:hypothetical protein
MPDDGQENWGASGPPASNCLLRLVDQDGNTLSQTAETFAIAESQLQLLHPNGGEIWATGTDRSFEWTSTCFTGNVRIDVSRSGPGGPWTVLLPSTPNDGFETYNVRPSDIGFVHARIVALPLGLPLDQCDAGFAIVDHEPPVQPQSGWHFDFLPAGAAPAPGYEAESGQPYDAAHGHGWNTAQVTKKRSMLADDSRDDFVQVVNNTTATWKLDLPNGAYEVSFVCGDPYTSGTHRVALENHLVVTDVYASGGTYVTRSNLPVTVLDGQLTVTLGGNGQITSTKLCGIDVRTVPSRQPRQRPKEQAPDSRSIGAVRWMNRLEMESRPFRDRAHFNLEFATDTAARVTVHDVRGRRVAMLHQGAMARGPHAMVWEPVDDHGRRLPSGVYFLQVESPLLQVSRKLVLVR